MKSGEGRGKSVTRHIVALGGGGFSESGAGSRIDDYILSLPGKEMPKVCFLPTASGDGDAYIRRFYEAFAAPRSRPSHVSLFHGPSFDPEPANLVHELPSIADHLQSQDVIYVGGGNTVAMLAVWRALGVDRMLSNAWEHGVVLCGLSAGSLCWFDSGTTDVFGEGYAPWFDGLGFVRSSHCPHFSNEPGRRDTYRRWVSEGVLSDGYAIDDHAAIHFADQEVKCVIAEHNEANAYLVTEEGELRLERTFV